MGRALRREGPGRRVSVRGRAIRFKEKDIRPMGRTAAGIRGIRLGKGDMVSRA